MTVSTTGWSAPLAPPVVPERLGAELSAARRLLRRLVEVMAAPVGAQERLDRMVRMIAADIVAEVCSAYVLRGEYLELFASEGLRPSAVHRTRLRIGEGLVGLIAAQGAVINLPEAQSHPDFAYRPETGEEIYHSFLGVPIVHGGRVAGVLVVQNRTQRHYSDEEVEALQIVAHGVRRDVRLGRPGRCHAVPLGHRPDRAARSPRRAAPRRGRGARRCGPASVAHRGRPPGRR